MKVKGTSIASFLGFLEAEYGPTRLKEFVSSLDANLKKRCEGLILASAFYPFGELEELTLKARDFFRPKPDFVERSGGHNASVGLAGVHQALLVRPTPLDFLKAAERAWGQFVDTGSVQVDVCSEGDARIRISGVPRSEVFCARVTGFLNRSLELAGARSLRVTKVACTLSGAFACEWGVKWDAEASPRPQGLTTGIRRPVAL